MGRSFPVSSLTLQDLVGAAERLAARERTGRSRADWLALVEQARDRLAARPFRALPQHGFVVKAGEKRRVVAEVRPADRIIAEALLPLLAGWVERRATAAVHGFRRGRSTFTAAAAAREALRAGHRHVATHDVASFFPSVDRGRLAIRLESALSATLAEVVLALVSAPLELAGEPAEASAGLPLGNPLSPALSNIYLAPLDDAMSRAPAVFVRYADDLLFAARETEGLERAEATLREALDELGLGLNVEKSRRFVYAGAPFRYLGHLVDENGIYQPVPERAPRRRDDPEPPGSEEAAAAVGDPSGRTRTLYVTQVGAFLHVEQGLLVVRHRSEVLRTVPLRRLDRIVVLSGSSFTSGFVGACVQEGIQVLFFVGKGRAYGSIVGQGIANPLRLRAQYDLLATPSRRLALARAILDAKIHAMTVRLARVEQGEALRDQLAAFRARLGETVEIAVLMGIEGAATRAYYEGFAKRVRAPGFEFVRRSKQPPLDPVNSLLSFIYALLFGEMQTTLLAHGLDPYPGLLHELGRNHPALASDLVEPYRHLVGDSLVLTLVNQRVVDPGGFERRSNGAVLMTDETRRTVLAAYERFMSRPLGPSESAVSPRRLIHAAARAMLHVVLGEEEELRLPVRSSEATVEPDALEVVGPPAPVPNEAVHRPPEVAPPEDAPRLASDDAQTASGRAADGA